MKTQLKLFCSPSMEVLEHDVNEWLRNQEDVSVSNLFVLPLVFQPGNVIKFYSYLLYFKEGWR